MIVTIWSYLVRLLAITIPLDRHPLDGIRNGAWTARARGPSR